MRILLTAAIATAALLSGAPASRAWEGNAPWCAYINIGTGTVYEKCVYRTVEECAPTVLAGNRGQCGPNPRWAWDQEELRKHRGKRHARAH